MHSKIKNFQKTIWDYYHAHGRAFAWRSNCNPYHVLVSEIMLQQTQTHRVAQKFEPFITTFPTVKALAQAPLRDVILLWQGLGYNRRAIALHTNAKRIMEEFSGSLPTTPEILETFASIGPNTASSICAFAFNSPTVFIETNIRAVFIHFFFPEAEKIDDKDLLPLIAQALDKNNPREWYYALMDYGVMLKKSCPNPARKSKHHVRQSTFQGSHRQIRGMILKLCSEHAVVSYEQLLSSIDREQQRIDIALAELCHEGFIQKKDFLFYLTP